MRIEQACKLVKAFKVDGLLIEHPSDILYLTGRSFSTARLLVKPDGASLIVDGRYFSQAQGTVPCEVILAEKEALHTAMRKMNKIGFDSTFVTVDKLNSLQTSIPSKEWMAIPRPLKELRVFKDRTEIQTLKKAAQITADSYQNILKHLKEGVEEQSIAFDFEVRCRKSGASKMSFDPIVAFGEHSAYPHYRAGNGLLKKNQIVLFDLGATFDHYQGDMTRIFFFGQPQETLEQFYGMVKQAHDLATAAIRPGTRVGELDRMVRAFFETKGVAHLFSHSLGHGVGIDVHEYPLIRFDGEDRDVILREGMVFTIEPGLYLPGIGGVRYENTHVVTDNGSENFYAAL